MKKIFSIMLAIALLFCINVNVFAEDFVRDINAGKPCLFTYGAKFGDDKGGHVVLVLGYVETTDYKYLKVADGWNHYLRYINFDGYDYNRKDGWSFGISK